MRCRRAKYDRDRHRKNTRKHEVPVGLVSRTVDRWLTEQAGPRPVARLAERLGLGVSCVERAVYRMRNETNHTTVEQADRYVDACYGERLWEVDPPAAAELAGHGLPCLTKPVRGDKRWMRADEKESPKMWARRVRNTMTAAEYADYLGAIESILDGDDRSTPARHASISPNRWLAA